MPRDEQLLPRQAVVALCFGRPLLATGERSAPRTALFPLSTASTRLDAGIRDAALDEALGLNCVWYADILMTLTEG